MAAMARQKHHLHATEGSQPQAVGGRAKGRVDRELLHVLQPFHGVEPAAAEHAEAGLGEVQTGG